MTEVHVDLEEQVKEVYAQAGLTLYFAQCFEMALTNFLVIHNFATNRRVTVEELLALESSNAKKTLGALLKKTKDLWAFDQDALDRLDLALEHRNYLSHHFFKDHGESFLSKTGREKMLDVLSNIQSSLQIADTMMEAANRAMSKAIGVTDETVQRELAKIYAAASDA